MSGLINFRNLNIVNIENNTRRFGKENGAYGLRDYTQLKGICMKLK